MTDEFVRVGPAAVMESYLDMEAIFKAIDKTGAQAVCDIPYLQYFLLQILVFK